LGPVNERQELPARLARLASGFAVIFVGESAAATSASTTTVMTTGVVATAATARTVAFWPGFVDLEITAAELFAVEGGHSFASFGIIGHFHEGKAASPAGLAIGDNVDAPDLAEGLEQSGQIGFGGLKTHISDKKTFHTISPFEFF
jgi:hypothetical protein